MGLLVAASLGLLALWGLTQLWNLYRNYQAAQLMGLTIVVVPYDPDGILFGFLSEPLKPVLRKVLPEQARRAFDMTLWGWEWHDKSATHERLGLSFVIVTAGLNRLVTADPITAHAILTRRHDFVHPEVTTQVMGLLGHNIITSGNESWSRQRRIVASALSERISSGVWAESVEQASGLADALLALATTTKTTAATTAAAPPTTDTVPGLRAIAINVLKRVAYDRPTPYSLPDEKASTPAPNAADMSYVDAISLCTEMLLLAAFVPAAILRLPVMPRYVQRLGVAMARLPKLTSDMLEQERQSNSNHDESTATLATQDTNAARTPETIMRTLVRLSDEAKTGDEKDAQGEQMDTKTQFLTEDEIAGNLFIFTAAGFDTTANTLGYAVTVLAAYPQWQSWIQAEIDTVLYDQEAQAGGEAPRLPDYNTAYPRLVRCQAVMLETLRVYSAATMIMRSTEKAQTVPCSSSTDNNSASSLVIPARCAVHVNITALHSSPTAWGGDDNALKFDPTRWLKPGTSTGEDVNDIDGAQTPHETLRGASELEPGRFLPWSGGPRRCPGQKMSQVEFVAVIATLFGRCSVEPDVSGDVTGRDKEDALRVARQRLLETAEDSQILFTLAMNKPRDVRLRWTPRRR